MKKILFIIITAFILFPATVEAQGQPQNKKDWKELWKAEKVAFLTNAIDLTSSEAEVFWPLYNKCEREKNLSFRSVMGALKALDEGVEAGKNDAEIAKLLDAYLKALQKDKDIDAKYADEYRKILSEKKVAKLFIGEEQFRRRQIHSLNKGKKD